MNPLASPCTLSTVLASLGTEAVLVSGGDFALGRSIRAVVIWNVGDPVPNDPEILAVCGRVTDERGMEALRPLLTSRPTPIVVVPADVALVEAHLRGTVESTAVVAVPLQTSAVEIISVVARETQTAEELVFRRLASLQRTLSLSLTESSPIPALLARLKKMCNATVALVDVQGRAAHATGPLPLNPIFEQLGRSAAPSQVIDLDGWHIVTARVEGGGGPETPFGWLIAAARREHFADPYTVSAIHVAATLIEASHRLASVARRQEQAVRSTMLEQALALKLERNDPELAARMAGLGIQFDEELHVAVVRPLRASPVAGRERALQQLAGYLARTLRSGGTPQLTTVRDDHLVVLAQCSVQTLKRLSVSANAKDAFHLGVGRRVSDIGDVVDSYNDAQLAVRALRRGSKQARFVAYEEFDFATRLFSEISLEHMVVWAEEFLGPLDGRDALLEGVRAYFEHNQNINAAADSLSIHHNSLRYRLAKVEELLEIDLKAPPAVSSMFLALTAMDLSGAVPDRIRAKGRRQTGQTLPEAIDSSEGPTEFRIGDRSGRLGVVAHPEHY